MTPPKSPKPKLLTLSQAAIKLGIKAKGGKYARRNRAVQLQQRLEALEASKGQSFIIRLGSGPKAHLYTSEALLRLALPELFLEHPTTQAALENVRQQFILIRARIKEISDALEQTRQETQETKNCVLGLKSLLEDINQGRT